MPSNTVSQVLFVDDDEDTGVMLSLLLRSHDIELTCAQSAPEAWLKIQAECFDLFLLDAWLPKVDGFELCRQIRQCDSTTPILFYSGAAYDADKQKGIAAGANAYVTKPDIDGLVTAMTDLLAEAGMPMLRRQCHYPSSASGAVAFNLHSPDLKSSRLRGSLAPF